MTAPSRRPWSLWDGPRCLHTGSVLADSDADGLRAVLADPVPVPLSPDRHYRVRVGSAVASAAGDEFVRTAKSSSVHDDAPALEARAARERAEAEARRLMGRELADRLAKLPPFDPAWLDREGYEERLREAMAGPSGDLEPLEYDPATGASRPAPAPVERGPRPSALPPDAACPAGGLHGLQARTVEVQFRPPLDRYTLTVRAECRLCRLPVAVQVLTPIGPHGPGVTPMMVDGVAREVERALGVYGSVVPVDRGALDRALSTTAYRPIRMHPPGGGGNGMPGRAHGGWSGNGPGGGNAGGAGRSATTVSWPVRGRPRPGPTAPGDRP